MKFKLKKEHLIIISIGLFLIVLGLLCNKVYFEGKRRFEYNEKMFKESVESYYKAHKYELPKLNSFKTITLQDIYESGLLQALEIGGKRRFCNEDTSFVRTINNNNEYTYLVYLDCGKYKSKIDSKAPEIILEGDSKIILNIGEEYKEPGIKTIVDDKDGVIDNSKLEITNNIDTTKPGNYKVNYTVYDSSFNKTTVTRNVVVAETLNQAVKKNTDESNIYKGNVENNYLLFSGMLFRIVKENEDGTIKIVSDDNIAHMSYIEDNYDESNLRKWLNEYYYSNINENSKKYIVKGDWCTNKLGENNLFECSKITKDYIGLLNYQEYIDTFIEKNSYFNGPNNNTLLLNKDYNDELLITSLDGNLKNYYIGLYYGSPDYGNKENMYPSVRPSFNLKKNIYLIKGNGSYDNPYMINDYKIGKTGSILNDRLIGEYVKYSGMNMRISKKDDGLIELISDQVIKYRDNNIDNVDLIIKGNNINFKNFNLNEQSNIGYLLNNTYINYIDNYYLISGQFDIPTTDNKTLYKDIKTKKISGKMFIPITYMMFSSNTTEILKLNEEMMSYNMLHIDNSKDENRIFISNSVNQIAFDIDLNRYDGFKIKPIIFVNSNIKIKSGNGTRNNPYIIR